MRTFVFLKSYVFKITLFILLFPFAVDAETLYVKSSKTKLRKEESTRAAMIQLLSPGTPVKVLIKHKRFYRVQTPKGKEGWVFKFKLTARKPSGKSAKSALSFADILSGGPSISVLESSSGSSIRGLSPAVKSYAKSKGLSSSAVQAVTNMETYQVDDRELEKFLQKGRLGEYAR